MLYFGKNNKNFKDLWKWSVDKPEIFWSEFWDFSEIIGEKGNEILRKNKIFNKNILFPNAKLNYTENLIQKRNDDLAINFLSEIYESLLITSKGFNFFFSNSFEITYLAFPYSLPIHVTKYSEFLIKLIKSFFLFEKIAAVVN